MQTKIPNTHPHAVAKRAVSEIIRDFPHTEKCAAAAVSIETQGQMMNPQKARLKCINCGRVVELPTAKDFQRAFCTGTRPLGTFSPSGEPLDVEAVVIRAGTRIPALMPRNPAEFDRLARKKGAPAC